MQRKITSDFMQRRVNIFITNSLFLSKHNTNVTAINGYRGHRDMTNLEELTCKVRLFDSGVYIFLLFKQ
jgi:hypothetical protein